MTVLLIQPIQIIYLIRIIHKIHKIHKIQTISINFDPFRPFSISKLFHKTYQQIELKHRIYFILLNYYLLLIIIPMISVLYIHFIKMKPYTTLNYQLLKHYDITSFYHELWLG